MMIFIIPKNTKNEQGQKEKTVILKLQFQYTIVLMRHHYSTKKLTQKNKELSDTDFTIVLDMK